jgi:hypothetical protein
MIKLYTRGSQEITAMTNQEYPCLVLVILEQEQSMVRSEKQTLALFRQDSKKTATNKQTSTIDSFIIQQ